MRPGTSRTMLNSLVTFGAIQESKEGMETLVMGQLHVYLGEASKMGGAKVAAAMKPEDHCRKSRLRMAIQTR